jgi:DNA repair protein RecN (Recombination protein N)
MLLELNVENFAVVERLRLRFHAGLNALTGETGSGKSLVVDALGLLFGGRASSELLRTGAERAFVSGLFSVPQERAFAALLSEAGIEPEDGELLIEREILSNGKSRAFVGSRPAAAALLKEIAPYLGDIHGQHDQQRLFSPDAQREIIDEAAGIAPQSGPVGDLFARWMAARRELDELTRAEQEKNRLSDLWRMQRSEIDGLGLKPGEDQELENERRVLKNVAKLSENVTAAYDALQESESSAAHNVTLALKRLEELARIDETLQPLVETLRPAQIAIQDASHELMHYLGNLEADPARLETVESRLAAMEKLKRKYGNSIEEILAFREQVASQLDAVENAGERRAALENQITSLETSYRTEAIKLRSARMKAARKLEKQVESELVSLAMKGTQVKIEFREAAPASHGMDEVQFLVSANVGEDPRPLDKVASGGELSRIALALKTSAPGENGRRTLVFDEVDAGVGGSAAEAVGRRLKKISSGEQVLCVTHLAQIAGFADHHYVVSKREAKGRTVAEVTEVKGDQRVREIGRMLSGERVPEEALRHADRLLREYARTTIS